MEIRLKKLNMKTEQEIDRSRDFKNESPYKKKISGTLEADVKIETTMGEVIATQKFDIKALPPLMVKKLLEVYSEIEVYIENGISIKDDNVNEMMDDRDITVKKNSNPNFEYMSIIDPEENNKRRVEALESIKPLMKTEKKTIKFSELTEEQKNKLYEDAIAGRKSHF